MGFNTPSQVSMFKSTLEGSTGDPFMPSKPHVPNCFPFRIHGLGTWITSWTFLTFIVSICWSLGNLVSTPLSLEVQSWGRWCSSFILLTSVDMTTLGHYSRQVEGGRKLMGQPLVHPQRLGSLIRASSYTWLEMNKGWLSTFKPLAGTFLDWNFAPF